ncbi:MAG: hypothetical protein OXO49_06040 [Gammaproteobacteria bacterium]|nr:hypothetical protein [Gammaproteobacteria bacterium]MDE0251918.1 hypothetical protein [Gammaproteobacteria bacterium]MDE0403073.1 hypothetical protein [Gammaproteobacteria bacterium]
MSSKVYILLLKDHYIKCMEAAMTAANFSNVGWLVGIPVIGPILGIAGLISAATSLGIGLHCNATKPSKEKCGELED